MISTDRDVDNGHAITNGGTEVGGAESMSDYDAHCIAIPDDHFAHHETGEAISFSVGGAISSDSLVDL